jgi:hypothetical protein
MVFWLGPGQEGAIVNLQKQSTPVIEQDENDPTLPEHGVAAPLQAARRQQQSNAVVSQLHTMNLRLTRIEANDSTANDLKNFVGNQFSIVHNRLIVLPARQAGATTGLRLYRQDLEVNEDRIWVPCGLSTPMVLVAGTRN